MTVLLLSAALVRGAAFQAGEEMEFRIRVLGINAAWQKVKVHGLQDVNGRPAWHITSVIKTYPYIDGLYRLRDDSTLWLDAETFQVLRVVSFQEEGKIRKQTYITNFPEERTVRHHDNLRGLRLLPYEPPVLDLIGMIYYGRTRDLAQGRRYVFNIIDAARIRRIETVVTGRETRKTSPGYPDRKVPLLVMEQSGDSDVAVWFTDDNRKVPVRIRTMKIKLLTISLGNIESVLVKYKER